MIFPDRAGCVDSSAIGIPPAAELNSEELVSRSGCGVVGRAFGLPSYVRGKVRNRHCVL